VISTRDSIILALEAAAEKSPKAKKQREMLARAFIETFSTKNGKIVLQALATMMKVFNEAETEEDRVLQNAFKRIQYIMGTGTEEEHVEAMLRRANADIARRSARYERKARGRA